VKPQNPSAFPEPFPYSLSRNAFRHHPLRHTHSTLCTASADPSPRNPCQHLESIESCLPDNRLPEFPRPRCIIADHPRTVVHQRPTNAVPGPSASTDRRSPSTITTIIISDRHRSPPTINHHYDHHQRQASIATNHQPSLRSSPATVSIATNHQPSLRSSPATGIDRLPPPASTVNRPAPIAQRQSPSANRPAPIAQRATGIYINRKRSLLTCVHTIAGDTASHLESRS
jgi:hypothetical protein